MQCDMAVMMGMQCDIGVKTMNWELEVLKVLDSGRWAVWCFAPFFSDSMKGQLRCVVLVFG